ncbi:MAG TPA: hypothetical protein QKA14_02690 [Candidatus Megaira endosymbiont of Hartmannula sinica]|nr:hypothetical protein [Candidatus Megaera endosymbiont of Hartmannula sinica]
MSDKKDHDNIIIDELYKPGKYNLMLIYSLMILGIFSPIIPIFAGILCYINLNNKSAIWAGHYKFSFNTFIIFLVFNTIVLTVIDFSIMSLIFNGSIATVILKFFNIIPILGIAWVLIRSARALRLITNNKPHPNCNDLFIG